MDKAVPHLAFPRDVPSSNIRRNANRPEGPRGFLPSLQTLRSVISQEPPIRALCNLLRSAALHEDRGRHVTGIGFTKTASCFIQNLTVPQLVMKFFAFYGTPNVHDRDHNSPLPAPVLSQSNLALKPSPSFVNIMLILIPSRPRSTHQSFPSASRFPSLPCRIPHSQPV
jgi:hypothetical protein